MRNESRIYIEDFNYDLNYQRIILYVGDIENKEKLMEKLKKDYVNHLNRFEGVFSEEGHGLMYIENCDLQDITYPELLHDLIAEGYTIAKLHEDIAGYYIKPIEI